MTIDKRGRTFSRTKLGIEFGTQSLVVEAHDKSLAIEGLDFAGLCSPLKLSIQ